jgi:hypothetical protein
MTGKTTATISESSRLIFLDSNSFNLNPYRDMIAMAKKKPVKKTETPVKKKKK